MGGLKPCIVEKHTLTTITERLPMMITKPARVKKLTNFPKKSKPFFNGFKFENKYFSGNYPTELANIHSTFPNSKGCEFFSVKMKLHSSAFSVDNFGNDCIRLHEVILRTIFVHLSMMPVGFHLYFDSRSKSVLSTFFLVNYNRMADVKAVHGEVSKQSHKELMLKVKERVGNSSTLSLSSAVTDMQPSVSIEKDALPDTPAADFAVLLGDPDYRKAMERALRGLPLNKAQKLASSVNKIIEDVDDAAIEQIKIPKRKHGSQSAPVVTRVVDKRSSENLLEFIGFDV